MNGIITWSPGMSLDSIEKLIILEAFRFFRFNKTATAQSLGISIRTLDNKLEIYDQDTVVETERAKNAAEQRTKQLERARGNPPNNVGVPYSPSDSFPRPPLPNTTQPFATAGTIRMESVVNATAQPALPMPERAQVQTVLSRPNAQTHIKKGR